MQNLLLTPGPTMVPDFVREAMARPVIHQRTPEFTAFYKRLATGLQYLFQTSSRVVTVAGSGTIGMQTALSGVLDQSEKVLVLEMGRFSERWTIYCQAQGIDHTVLACEWGRTITDQQVLEALKAKPHSAVVLTHCETSTGAQIDLETMADAIRRAYPDCLIIVDAISTAGIVPLYAEDWGLDVVVAASQKGLCCPAGLSFISLSEAAMTRTARIGAGDPFHLHHYVQYHQQDSFPFTPPVQLMYAAVSALDHLRETTLPVRWNAIHARGRYFKKALQGLALQLFGDANADGMTAFQAEDSETLRQALIAEGITLAGGQGRLAHKLLRIGHFGPGDISVEETVIQHLAKIHT